MGSTERSRDLLKHFTLGETPGHHVDGGVPSRALGDPSQEPLERSEPETDPPDHQRSNQEDGNDQGDGHGGQPIHGTPKAKPVARENGRQDDRLAKVDA